MIHFRLGFMSAGRGWGEAADRQKGKEEAEKGGEKANLGKGRGRGVATRQQANCRMSNLFM